MTKQNNQELVQQCYRAFQTGDLAGLFDRMHDSITWHSLYTKGVSLNGTYIGKEQLGELLTKMGSDISMRSFEPKTFLADEHTVVVLGREEATVNKTQKGYQNSWVHVWEVADGKVAGITSYNTVENVLAAFTD